MSFADAISSVLTKNYANFSGRARRSEFWFFFLFTVIVSVVLNIIDAAIGSSIPGYLVNLALLVPSIAVGARRLHDTGRSGWWQLIYFTIVGIIVLIVWWCLDSKPDNQHGPNPKGLGGYAPGTPPPPPGAYGGYTG